MFDTDTCDMVDNFQSVLPFGVREAKNETEVAFVITGLDLDTRFVAEIGSCNSKLNCRSAGGELSLSPPRSQMKIHLPFYIIL